MIIVFSFAPSGQSIFIGFTLGLKPQAARKSRSAAHKFSFTMRSE
jgi:hypothetical protein